MDMDFFLYRRKLNNVKGVGHFSGLSKNFHCCDGSGFYYRQIKLSWLTLVSVLNTEKNIINSIDTLIDDDKDNQ